MSNKTRNILIAVIAVLTAAAITSMITGYLTDKNTDSRNIAGEAVKSAAAVTVNDIDFPAYDFNGETYIIADNLVYFGINSESDEDSGAMKLTSSDGTGAVEGVDIASSLIRPEDTVNVYYPDYEVYFNGELINALAIDGGTLIARSVLARIGEESHNEEENLYSYTVNGYAGETTEEEAVEAAAEPQGNGIIIVLDPGHGKDSASMTDEEKKKAGWKLTDDGWGEWRHFKYGQSSPDCEGEGCSGRVPPNGACWYPIENSDRDTEPEINLNNCLAAEKYLRQMGYDVRLTRRSNDENPSITQRLTYCYPNNDTTVEADADIFLCIHSNAGGGSGSSYISLEGPYDQPNKWGSSDAYAEAGNALGEYINNEIGSTTLLGTNAPITYEPELIAFCKCPVICGYMEIGFFDNRMDLEILNTSSDAIGNAIAVGTDKFVREYAGLL